MTKRRKPKVFEQREMSASEAQAMMTGSECAWDGCMEHFEGPMPTGWRFLLVYWAERPDPNVTLGEIATSAPTCDRDGVLCPTHTRRLDALLKDLGRWTGQPMGGTA